MFFKHSAGQRKNLLLEDHNQWWTRLHLWTDRKIKWSLFLPRKKILFYLHDLFCFFILCFIVITGLVIFHSYTSYHHQTIPNHILNSILFIIIIINHSWCACVFSYLVNWCSGFGLTTKSYLISSSLFVRCLVPVLPWLRIHFSICPLWS